MYMSLSLADTHMAAAVGVVAAEVVKLVVVVVVKLVKLVKTSVIFGTIFT